MGKRIFVTVGTTRFDDLCDVVLSADCLRTFKKLGYDQLTVQYGNSKVDSDTIPDEGVRVNVYKFKDCITEDMRIADLVISHAGAGSILEALELGRPLVVVSNPSLMGGHQREIAQQLEEGRHLHHCSTHSLIHTLETEDLTQLQPYPKADTTLFYQYLNDFMGFKCKT